MLLENDARSGAWTTGIVVNNGAVRDRCKQLRNLSEEVECAVSSLAWVNLREFLEVVREVAGSRRGFIEVRHTVCPVT